MKIACHFDPDSRRSRHLALSMLRGIARHGDEGISSPGFTPCPQADAGVAYGWRHPDLFAAYRKNGRAYLYLDLGWWNRKPPSRMLDGYHKVMLNSRDDLPEYAKGSPGDRFKALDLKLSPWKRTGKHILVAGMSGKSAHTRGFGPLEWETAVVEKLRTLTNRPIIYRPKPSDPKPRRIEGLGYSPSDEAIERVLKDCWCVVTYHSNVAVDALLAGVPVHVEAGTCLPLSTPLERIEDPLRPDSREALLADLAYAQWSTDEMRSGDCWAAVRKAL